MKPDEGSETGSDDQIKNALKMLGKEPINGLP